MTSIKDIKCSNCGEFHFDKCIKKTYTACECSGTWDNGCITYRNVINILANTSEEAAIIWVKKNIGTEIGEYCVKVCLDEKVFDYIVSVSIAYTAREENG